jgi:hypothetical protein
MHEIEVLTVSAERASDDIAELWRDGEQIAYTHYDFDDGDLMLPIDPRRDCAPLVVEMRSLTRALAEIGRILALGRGPTPPQRKETP